MDLTKQGISSETSCEENDEKVKGVRTYNCTFCKRGFTNAQALGGHMNIHRKHKTKAKKVICHDQSSCLYQHKAKNALHWNNMANNSESFSPILSTYHRQHHHQYLNYQMHFSTTNPSLFPSDLVSSRPHGSYTTKNLSMRFGPAFVGDGEGEERNKGVDLELRLGRNP